MHSRESAPRSRESLPAGRRRSLRRLQLFSFEEIRPVPAEIEFVEILHHPHLELGSTRDAGAQNLLAHVLAIAAQCLAQPARAGDGIAVNAKIAQQLVGVGEAAAGQSHIDHQFPIPGSFARDVEPAGLQKRRAPEERGLLPEKTAFVCVASQIDGVGRAPPETGTASLADDANGAAERVDRWMTLE